jgi:hypothetical protein
MGPTQTSALCLSLVWVLGEPAPTVVVTSDWLKCSLDGHCWRAASQKEKSGGQKRRYGKYKGSDDDVGT